MGRIVFVTGASRGIGRGIAEKFLQQGDRVAVGYARNRELAEEIANSFDQAIAVQADLFSRTSIRTAIEKTRRHFGGSISVLVNNGAIAQEKPFFEITDENWDRMLATNLRGPFAFTQEVLPEMLKAGWGRIINISSIGGQWGGMNQVHYATAKAGLLNLTRSIAKLFSGQGITCNAIAPGLVETEMIAQELQTEGGRQKLRSIPAGRLGTVEEVASAVYYLSTDEAAYITGQTLNLNGGMYFD
jgi:NAD(P)-dependent dehydrogenase (short-subunit alcohol dehydrogenase family)